MSEPPPFQAAYNFVGTILLLWGSLFTLSATWTIWQMAEDELAYCRKKQIQRHSQNKTIE